MEFVSKSIRRKDRIMDDGNALRLLREAVFGVLSIPSGDGAYGVPITYAWDGGSKLYFHCAHKGRKLDLLAEKNRVSFCIVGKTKILYELASMAYESLILEGTLETELSDEEKRHGLAVLINRFSDESQPGTKFIDERMFNRVKIIRMDVATISGKRREDPGQPA